ncbi:MAG: SIR2 family protein [Deltaproteobacteria bacterium]|nr:SIR2 family protein [Deltaproteobacteria bacterium]
MDIPKILIDHVRDGQVVLFLGSGASFGAKHPEGRKPPLGQSLSDLLATKFLGDDFLGYTLQQVAELAINESDLFSVQSYISDIFMGFRPAQFHKLIPRFVWKAIATTNYDLIVERAYDSVPQRLQEPVVFLKNTDRVEEKLKQPNSICYFKLHGCITNINDGDTPLILTPDQYLVAKQGRSRLFERIESLAYEYPFVFIGHSLSDYDIRAILLNLSDLGEGKPRSYIVSPDLRSAENRFWQSKRYSCIKSSFEHFINELDKHIKNEFRELSKLTKEDEGHPFLDTFCSIDGKKPSESLKTFLHRDTEYIYKGLTAPKADAKAFYKGYFIDWSPIIENLDVKRSLNDSILSEVFLNNEEDRSEIVEFYLIKGHAGSGKSVLLNRLSYEAAIDFDKICIKLNPSGYPSYEPLVEMYSLCQKRLFLFIDPVSKYLDTINHFVREARRDKLPLTIVGAERNNVWNSECESLYSILTDTYQVRYLNDKEMDSLIELLERHKSLGHMEGLDKDTQKEMLSEKAGRQILVALHEATLGKPFSDIVFDEYNSIASHEAKSLYLTVCIMHRIGIAVRAGLISRVHGIPFTLFKDNLFAPLEFIVFARENRIIGDYQYQTRHQQIAEMVFERALSDPQDRFDEYIRLLNALDISFNSDHDAFFDIIKARKLIDNFADPQMIRQIYDAAKNRDHENPFILQQEAIFEMNSSGGSLDKATTLLQKASQIAPNDRRFSHSLSELSLKKAERSQNKLEKQKFLDEARSLAISLSTRAYEKERPTHTILKAEIEELKDILQANDQTLIERKVKQIQKILEKALQRFPDSSFILDSEATFSESLNRHPLAVEALKKAFELNKRSTYLAVRLSRMYEDQNEIEKSIQILKTCLDRNPGEKIINFKIAYMLAKYGKGTAGEIKYHLRRSYTVGDDNYASQFWYARCLYLEGDINEALKIFNNLKNQNIDNRIKQKARGIIKENGEIKQFSGTISRLEASYAFIVRDQTQDRLFTHISQNNYDEWKNLSTGRRVVFNMAFNYRGPQALKVCLENPS